MTRSFNPGIRYTSNVKRIFLLLRLHSSLAIVRSWARIADILGYLEEQQFTWILCCHIPDHLPYKQAYWLIKRAPMCHVHSLMLSDLVADNARSVDFNAEYDLSMLLLTIGSPTTLCKRSGLAHETLCRIVDRPKLCSPLKDTGANQPLCCCSYLRCSTRYTKLLLS